MYPYVRVNFLCGIVVMATLVVGEDSGWPGVLMLVPQILGRLGP